MRSASCKFKPEEQCALAHSEDRIECSTLAEATCPAGRTIDVDCGLRFDDESHSSMGTTKPPDAGRSRLGGLLGIGSTLGRTLGNLPPALRICVLVLVVVLAAVFLFPSTQTTPSSHTPPQVAPASATDPVPKIAIACSTAGSSGQTATEDIPDAIARAKACQDVGRLNDTLSIYSDLKERGSGSAALAMGQLYDPLDPSRQQAKDLPSSIVNAVELYRQACALNEPAAAAKLARLKGEAQKQAEASNDRILLDLVDKWPECNP